MLADYGPCQQDVVELAQAIEALPAPRLQLLGLFAIPRGWPPAAAQAVAALGQSGRGRHLDAVTARLWPRLWPRLRTLSAPGVTPEELEVIRRQPDEAVRELEPLWPPLQGALAAVICTDVLSAAELAAALWPVRFAEAAPSWSLEQEPQGLLLELAPTLGADAALEAVASLLYPSVSSCAAPGALEPFRRRVSAHQAARTPPSAPA